MAGDWIKVEVATPEKPEVSDIAGLTGLTPDDVLGKLIRVWIWFDQHTENGTLPRNASVTLPLRISSLVSHEGFGEAMLSTGWLTEKGLPNFDRHNGKSAKTRALAKNRMQRFRNAPVTPAASPEKRRGSIYQSPSLDTKNDARPRNPQAGLTTSTPNRPPAPQPVRTGDLLAQQRTWQGSEPPGGSVAAFFEQHTGRSMQTGEPANPDAEPTKHASEPQEPEIPY